MRLKDISTYRDDCDYRFYMKLTYVYEDVKGNEHTRAYPKVDFPLELSLDLPIIEAPSLEAPLFGPNMYIKYNDSQQISYGDVFIHTGSVSVPANVDIDVYYIDYISKPYVRKMTLKEIEKRLGYKVEVVSDKKEEK